MHELFAVTVVGICLLSGQIIELIIGGLQWLAQSFPHRL
jgi:hypothetical protein